MLQLIIFYYGPGLVGKWAQTLESANFFVRWLCTWHVFDRFFAVMLAFVINYACYFSEIFRGGLSAIPSGQYEAGYACGLTKIQTFRRVVIPQAARIVLPSVEVGIVLLFQNTSMAASIGVRDLMGRASLMGAFTKHYTENYFCTAVVFIVVSILLELLFNLLNKKLQYVKK